MIKITKTITETVELTEERFKEYVEDLIHAVGYDNTGCQNIADLKYYLNEDCEDLSWYAVNATRDGGEITIEGVDEEILQMWVELIGEKELEKEEW